MTMNLGVEAIAFQANSPFAKDLIEIFQEPIELRKKLKEEGKSISELANAVEKYFFKVTGPKIGKVLQKHTGIPVGKLYVTRRFSMMFACMVDFDNDKGINMHTTIQRYSGLEVDPFIEEYIEQHKHKVIDPKEIAKLASKLDLKTGKMDVKKLAGKAIKFILHFDYNSAFLAKETGHMNCEYMTAEEISAIVLHEVGHMMTMFEHSADIYFRATFYNHLMAKGFVANADKYQLIYFALDFLKSQFPKKEAQINALSEKVREYQQKHSKGAHTSSVPVFITLLHTLFVSLLSLVFSTLFLPFRLLGGILMPMFEVLTTSKKMSDYADLKQQYKYCEQLADEFVSRHGLSAGLASGLQKIFAWCKITGIGSTVAKNSSLAWTAAKIPYFIYSVFYGDLTGGGGLYDVQYDRALRAMENTLRAFKEEGLDKELIDYFIKDYENAKEIVADIKRKNKFTDTMQLVQDCMSYILSTPVDSLFTGRFLSEYNKLQNNVEKLMRNTLPYHRLKLEQLKKKL